MSVFLEHGFPPELELEAKIYSRACDRALKRFKLIPPTAQDIEFLSACVDVFHNRGAHQYAHHLDSEMCAWAGLLLDA
ncbi:hypothetical protein [Pseudoalteromonas rhizosphaerae]|uniref:Uncharacterized protein n=1 Tax=Pseudoalteromonas rhizosphaerae TaxID=2518973 RepID=A0ABW8L2V4_9GAMM